MLFVGIQDQLRNNVRLLYFLFDLKKRTKFKGSIGYHLPVLSGVQLV
jgi:hypothetical protein